MSMPPPGPNDIIHQAVRLKIMAALNAVPKSDLLEFGPLKAITGATDGNLGAHLGTLADAGYVKITKDYVGRKPRTLAAIVIAGRRKMTANSARRIFLEIIALMPTSFSAPDAASGGPPEV